MILMILMYSEYIKIINLCTMPVISTSSLPSVSCPQKNQPVFHCPRLAMATNTAVIVFSSNVFAGWY